MDWEKFASNFGLPGLMLVGLYLIARYGIAAWERTTLERIKVEDKRADAHVAALTSLNGKVDAHHQTVLQNHTADLQSHSEIATEMASLHTKLDTFAELTPVRGVPRVDPSGTYGPQFPRSKTSPGGGR